MRTSVSEERHCERSEAIQNLTAAKVWIASALARLAMTAQADFRCPDYPKSTASAPVTASALSVTVFSSAGACTERFSAKKRAMVT
jgi:hypothetical protein